MLSTALGQLEIVKVHEIRRIPKALTIMTFFMKLFIAIKAESNCALGP